MTGLFNDGLNYDGFLGILNITLAIYCKFYLEQIYDGLNYDGFSGKPSN